MGQLLSNNNASRLYADLIFQISARYPNWDPPKRLQIGDYGTINKNTGEFQVEGNMFRLDPSIVNAIDPKVYATLMAYGVEPAYPDTQYVIASQSGRAVEFNAGPDVAAIGGDVPASVGGKWEFSKGKRGALLVMARPRLTHITNEILGTLSKIKPLVEKSVVVQVYTCPAYVMYMTEKSGGELSLSLQGSWPNFSTPSAVGPMTAEAIVQWVCNHSGGLYRESCNKAGEEAFTPLFHVMTIPRPARGELWKQLDMTTQPPWAPLDEDGIEAEEEWDDGSELL
ncbi:hypothetical protein FRB99_008161 [Tulasnella sp. 403]|nr:hypothetical protein FRB99_008161 [Tulasnella sp. 403]